MSPSARFCPAGHGVFAFEAELCPGCGDRLILDRAGHLVGDYVCERLLGVGGMASTVWEARLDPDEPAVAVKIVESGSESQEALRLIQSASIMCGVDHPNIARIYAYGETDAGEAFVAMELLRGKSLLQVLQQRGHLPARQALHVASELLAALGFVHGRDIIHRDVKPANIYLTPPGDGRPWEVRLIDFGIAKQTSERAPDHLELDEPPGAWGPILGTPEYMAPEQVLGLQSDARADLYSAAIVLYRMLTGALPFSGASRVELYEQQLRARPQAPAAPSGELAAGLVATLGRALEKHPGMRFQTADELRAALS